MSETHLLDGEEAAELLRMLPRRIGRLTRAGKIPFVKLPDGELRYDAHDLWAWVESHKQPATAVAHV